MEGDEGPRGGEHEEGVKVGLERGTREEDRIGGQGWEGDTLVPGGWGLGVDQVEGRGVEGVERGEQ